MKPTIHSQNAFAMSELMVVIVIIAILAAIAIPSVGSLVSNTRLSTTSSSFIGAMAFARAEAGRRGVRVTICPGSIDATSKQVVTANNACNTTAGATLWNEAYLVFAETKAGGTLGQYETGDTLLRAESIPTGITLTPSFTDIFISVLPSGSIGVGGTVQLCYQGLNARQLTIKRTGTATSQVTATICP